RGAVDAVFRSARGESPARRPGGPARRRHMGRRRRECGVHRGRPLVLRFVMGLYTANLHANTAVVRDLAMGADPRPKTVVLDLCRLPRVTSTVLDGLWDLDAELGGQGIRLVFANLPAPARHSAEGE